MTTLLEQTLTREIIGAFYDVYNELGFGFLEKVYTLAMERELVARGLKVGREVSIPIFYKGQFLTNHRADLIVEEKVIVENKSSELLPKNTRPTVVNYLRATSIEVALLLHFGPEAKFYRIVSTKR